MARRWIEEINAGSMADIAFLILIYFLMTTTMDVDEGIAQKLPPKEVRDQSGDRHDRDVLEISINSKDQVMVDGEFFPDISQLDVTTEEFLTNKNNKGNLPEMILVNETIAKKKLIELKTVLSEEEKKDSTSERIGMYNDKIKLWEARLSAAVIAGEYKTLPDMAVITLTNDNSTTYEIYVRVQDEIHSAHNRLRNKWAQIIYKENYTDWKDFNAEDAEKIQVIRTIVPMNLAEQIPKNIKSY